MTVAFMASYRFSRFTRSDLSRHQLLQPSGCNEAELFQPNRHGTFGDIKA